MMPGRFDTAVPANLAKQDAVERLAVVAEQAGLTMIQLALGFVTAHPGVTSAIIGPRTMEHLDDLLAGAEVTLDDDTLDAIDEIVPPGTDVDPGDVSYAPPAIEQATLRRRPGAERAAA